ncbi:MAG: hypothetical protein ACPLOU_07165 [bacterium]
MTKDDSLLAQNEKPERSHSEIDGIAEEYVRLCFSLEEHCPGYVDAYFGPGNLKEKGTQAKRSLPQIKQAISSLLSHLEEIEQVAVTPRTRSLRVHLRSMWAKANLLDGAPMTFDEESQALYDAVPPSFSSEEFQTILQEIDSLLPGTESLNERAENLRQEFRVPQERLDVVMKAAIEEARARTTRRIPLPEGENFTVELVSEKPWSGYNWFRGNAQSLIQVNTDLPVYLDMIITLACHEGYPGHHVFNCLREEELYRKRGWVEFSVFPLFGPDALIAEGSANFAVEMVFPTLQDRLRFESEILCPLAGINTRRLGLYENVLVLMRKLAYAQVEAARRYLDGKISQEEAVEWLIRYRLLSQGEAEHSLKFIEFYRSYVINYKLGEDLVKAYVEGQGGVQENQLKRWQVFHELLISPIVPSDLKK